MSAEPLSDEELRRLSTDIRDGLYGELTKLRRLVATVESLLAAREQAFNAGWNAGIRGTTPKEVLARVRFDHPQMVKDRREAYERWQLRRRV